MEIGRDRYLKLNSRKRGVKELSDATFQAVYDLGLENVTTKVIAKYAQGYEVTIYRCFDGKKGLLEFCFDSIIDDLLHAVEKVDSHVFQEMERTLRIEQRYFEIWEYVKNNPLKAEYFRQYSRSKYCSGKHNEFFTSLVSEIYERSDVFTNHNPDLMMITSLKLDGMATVCGFMTMNPHVIDEKMSQATVERLVRGNLNEPENK